jgi:hypothetical protein
MLTMAPSANDDLERLESAAEKLSLHRLRDAMGQGLEPLVGMLRWDLYYSVLSSGSCVVKINEAGVTDCGPRIRQYAQGSGASAILCAFQSPHRILSRRSDIASYSTYFRLRPRATADCSNLSYSGGTTPLRYPYCILMF